MTEPLHTAGSILTDSNPFISGGVSVFWKRRIGPVAITPPAHAGGRDGGHAGRGLGRAAADANRGLDHLRWGRWNGVRATAPATAYANTCDPSCVDGQALSRPRAGIPRIAWFQPTRFGPLSWNEAS